LPWLVKVLASSSGRGAGPCTAEDGGAGAFWGGRLRRLLSRGRTTPSVPGCHVLSENHGDVGIPDGGVCGTPRWGRCRRPSVGARRRPFATGPSRPTSVSGGRTAAAGRPSDQTVADSASREQTHDFIEANYERLASGRGWRTELIELEGNLCDEQRRSEVEAFFRATPRGMGAEPLLGATLRKIQDCASRRAAGARLAEFLERY
jgi:hypothetical protein